MSQVSKPDTTASDALTIPHLHAAIAGGAASARSIAQQCFKTIHERDGEIHAFLSLAEERALTQAGRIDGLAAAGDALPALAGIPMGIKDALTIQGLPATAGSRVLENFIAPYTATAVRRLEDAGAVILGKLNCDEFCDGFLQRELRLWAYAQPVRSRPCSRWIVRGLGRGGRRRHGCRIARDGYGRLYPPAGQLLRRCRRPADLWPRLPLWADRLCVFAGPGRPVCQYGA